MTSGSALGGVPVLSGHPIHKNCLQLRTVCFLSSTVSQSLWERTNSDTANLVGFSEVFFVSQCFVVTLPQPPLTSLFFGTVAPDFVFQETSLCANVCLCICMCFLGFIKNACLFIYLAYIGVCEPSEISGQFSRRRFSIATLWNQICLRTSITTH